MTAEKLLIPRFEVLDESILALTRKLILGCVIGRL
ncbi:MAG: hypothetical protein QG594_2505 [Bacteroidota bacterium]|nr:hypothetical protein [Bacteroidota bacterium]